MFTNEAEPFRGHGALNRLVMYARWQALLARLTDPTEDIEKQLRIRALTLYVEPVCLDIADRV
jgi:hypothetical protein